MKGNYLYQTFLQLKDIIVEVSKDKKEKEKNLRQQEGNTKIQILEMFSNYLKIAQNVDELESSPLLSNIITQQQNDLNPLLYKNG